MDDVLVHTHTWEEHVITLRELFRRMKEANLIVQPSKCVIGKDKIELLGHEVGQGIRTTHEWHGKWSEANDKKGTTLFLSLSGFYRAYTKLYRHCCPSYRHAEEGPAKQAELGRCSRASLSQSKIL